MWEDLEHLKRQLPLLEYLWRHNWTGRRVSCRQEYIGLCPLHLETRPSFYVNATKNLFYCHGCGCGGDLIRFVQLYCNLSFQDSVAQLEKELSPVASVSVDQLLEDAVAFYQDHLHRHKEALQYLNQRGLCDLELIRQMGIGYAPGGSLRRHLAECGYSLDLMSQVGLVNRHGCDTFLRRVVFPCVDRGRLINLYGRSIGGAPTHRFLPRPKGGLFAWERVRTSRTVILVEGLFDLAVLWQAGFLNTTCALGTHPTQEQFLQLCDQPGREVLIAFDFDPNGAGQQAARSLAQRLDDHGLGARIVQLPEGEDPNSYFVAGATAADFASCLQQAQPL